MGTLQKHHSKLLLITAHSYIFVEKKEKYPQFLDEKKCLIWSCVCSLLISSSACKELVHYQVGCLIKTCVSLDFELKRYYREKLENMRKKSESTHTKFLEKKIVGRFLPSELFIVSTRNTCRCFLISQ